MGCFIPHKRQAFPVWPGAVPEASALWTFDGIFDDTKGFFSTDYVPPNATFSSDALSGQSLASSSSFAKARYKRAADFIPKHTLCGWMKCAIANSTPLHVYGDSFRYAEVCDITTYLSSNQLVFDSTQGGRYGTFSFADWDKWTFVGYTTAGRLFVRAFGEEIKFMDDQTGDGLSSWVGIPIDNLYVWMWTYHPEDMLVDHVRFFWGQELTDEQITQLAYEFD